MVAKIFSQPTPVSPACVALFRVLLADVDFFSSSHPLDQEELYLLQALDVDLCVETEVMMFEDERRLNINIASDHSKHHDVDWVFGSHQYRLQ